MLLRGVPVALAARHLEPDHDLPSRVARLDHLVHEAAVGGDEVIEPRQTRRKIIAGLEMARAKRDRNPPKKHGNIPL